MTITLIIPCYNEELNIQKGVLDKFNTFVTHHPEFKEVLIVDDGSSDSTKRLIKEQYLPENPKFRLVENKHMGKAFAIIRGIEEAKSDYVLFSDIDLATPIEEALKLMKAASVEHPIVIGSRAAGRKGAPIVRKIMAGGFILIRNIILGLHGIKDTQCGFKMFRTQTAREIIKNLRVFNHGNEVFGSSVTAGFDLEFLFLAQRSGYKIKEIPVEWRHVETKNVHFFVDTIETLRDISRIKIFELTGKY